MSRKSSLESTARGSGRLLRLMLLRNKVRPTRVGSLTEELLRSHSFSGCRSDLVAVKRLLDSGAAMRDVADEHFSSFIRYERGLRSYRRLKTVKRDWAMELVFLIGPSGTGKSRWARATYPSAYWKPKGQWWDGYDGEETVVVDEMYGHCFPYTELLQLLDRYPYAVQVKGGVLEFVSRRIIFTSNQEPRDWYSAEKTHSGPWESSPLCRRIREFGRVVYTGEVHKCVPVLPVGAPGDLERLFPGACSVSEAFVSLSQEADAVLASVDDGVPSFRLDADGVLRPRGG